MRPIELSPSWPASSRGDDGNAFTELSHRDPVRASGWLILPCFRSLARQLTMSHHAAPLNSEGERSMLPGFST